MDYLVAITSLYYIEGLLLMIAKSSKRLRNILLYLVIVVSIFSQIESISSTARPIMFVSWFLIFLYSVGTNLRRFRMSKSTKVFVVFYFFYFFYCSICSLCGGKHYSSNYLRIMTIPMMVSLVGDTNSDLSHEDIQHLLKVYVITAFIYGIWVQISYYPSYSAWLQIRQYLFQNKNSAAQIWASALFIAILYLDYNKPIQRFIYYSMSFYFLVISAISQCRTSLLSIAFVVVAFSLIRSRRKILLLGIFVIIGIAIWYIPFTNSFIRQALFLTKFAGSDINTFSNGRIGYWIEALKVFWDSPIVGSGSYYVDNSYLLILAESGLIGLIIIEPIWLYRAHQNFIFKGCTKSRQVLFSITIFYIVESILEGYPPFGPGVSSFLFWLLSSVLTSCEDIQQAESDENEIKFSFGEPEG